MIDLPFNTIDFAETWQMYLEHREEKKKPYKNNKSMAMGLKKLFRLSEGNEEIAIAILENAISENWQGFFPLEKNDPLMVKLRTKKEDVSNQLTAAQATRVAMGLPKDYQV